MEGSQTVEVTTFWYYGHLLSNVTWFKYLGCILMSMDDDYLEVVENLRKAKKK